MKRKNDPFAGIKITPHSCKQTIIYDYQPGVRIRFTLNPAHAAGYLSRGTIGLLDPQTGHLLQTHTDSKSHRFSDAATLELYISCPRQGETQEQVIRRTVKKRTEDLIKKYRYALNMNLREGKSLAEMSLRTAIELYATDYVIDESRSVELRKTYYNQLNKMAAAFEDKKLTDLTSGDFKRFCTSHPRKNGLEYVKRLYHFWQLSPDKRVSRVLPKRFWRIIYAARNAIPKSQIVGCSGKLLPRMFSPRNMKLCWTADAGRNWVSLWKP